DAGQRVEAEAPVEEALDRAGVARGVVDVAFFRVRRDDQGRDARARSPAVAPGRGDVVPPAAVLVDRDDDHRVRPLRALLQCLDQVAHVRVTEGQVRVTGVHVEIALRL